MIVELPFKSYGGGYHVKEIGAFNYIRENTFIRFVKKDVFVQLLITFYYKIQIMTILPYRQVLF